MVVAILQRGEIEQSIPEPMHEAEWLGARHARRGSHIAIRYTGSRGRLTKVRRCAQDPVSIAACATILRVDPQTGSLSTQRVTLNEKRMDDYFSSTAAGCLR
jgi:hypothetical protein